MNPFASLVEIQSTYGSCLPGCHGANAQWPWRLVPNAPTGQINALFLMRGQAVATNGILVAIYQSSGKFVFGHYDWFVCDAPDEDGNVRLDQQEKAAKGRKQISASELAELLE